MRVSRETKEKLQTVNYKILRGVLEEEVDKTLLNLKVNSDIKSLRYFQGVVNTLEEILELITKK